VAARDSRKDFHAVAWAGVGFDVPADWDLASADGDFYKGYFRVDGPEMVRLEARWEHTTPPGRIGELTDRYLALLVKGKHLPSAQAVRRDTRLIEIPDAQIETFIWNGPVDVIGMAMRCRLCNRSILARLTAKKSESALTLARRVLASIHDHACMGRRAWAALDFRFNVPERFRCRRNSLHAGRLEFEFEDGRVRLTALRMNLAETVLRSKSLSEWAREQLKLKKRDTFESKERSFRGHAACDAEGIRKGFLPLVGRRRFRVLAWHCAESNALYLAQRSGPVSGAADLETFAESFRCHA
jgi:hypothetical protein